MSENNNRDSLIAAAKRALENSYSPYSKFRVGAALRFADGTVVTGTNIENASYGLTLCAETVAIAKAMDDGHRGGLDEIAVIGDTDAPVTPCGRCRQVLNEMAELGATDPIVYCAGSDDVVESRLSELLPRAFGPASLSDD
jgi:cytidine deaminase